ncbi:MAG: nucleotidyl transferase AbiEii/AbiGii toxin family protein [Longimicrobiales bacterium]|nr:nucleotidyl transferase AbiEii/AbiGii toxin family protein [Longimicrobiales bacterium]
MTFLHDRKDFPDLVAGVATERGVADVLVEKDYWVCHVLWSLKHVSGFEIQFKGGTSLSKGFGLIERFSEDLDIKLLHPDVEDCSDWSSMGKQAARRRRAFFEKVLGRIAVPGATCSEDRAGRDPYHRSVVVQVAYPQVTGSPLANALRPFVQLEIGDARVMPGEGRIIRSWVHEFLSMRGGLPDGADDSAPGEIHCVTPVVTLLEKIEAIHRRATRGDEPSTFVRHYEDGFRILIQLDQQDRTLARDLLREMLELKQIRRWPDSDSLGWRACEEPGMQTAWEALGGMYWGARVPLSECSAALSAFAMELARSAEV